MNVYPTFKEIASRLRKPFYRSKTMIDSKKGCRFRVQKFKEIVFLKNKMNA